MKRFLQVLLVCLMLPFAAAQNTGYLGIRLSGGTALDESAETVPFLGLQLGFSLAPFELRGAIETFLLASVAHADLLYTQNFSDDIQGYIGIGPDLYSNAFVGEANYGAHATVGVEYRTGSVGLFAEGQPIYAFSALALRGRLGLGVNFHF